MTLYHHDGRDYAEAASDAARKARDTLDKLIARGRDRAGNVLEQVMTKVPNDRVVPAQRIAFAPTDDGRAIIVRPADGPAERLHAHAAGQVAERTGVPRAFANELLAPARAGWGPELLAHNYNEVLKRDGNKYLLRSVDAEMRGFLSSAYRRLDSRPIVEAFATVAADAGAVPVEGYALDTKVALKAMVARVYEPVPNEVMAFGVMLENSDFGNGALQVSTFILRLWCTNYAIGEVPMRQVHLGKRLSEDMVFSQQTYELDTAATVSAVRDIVRANLEPGKIDGMCDAVRRANAEKVEPGRINDFLRKACTKDETKQITEAFASADVVNMPPGQTAWRMSNAISWIAGKTEDEGRRIELMKLAGAAAKVGAPAATA